MDAVCVLENVFKFDEIKGSRLVVGPSLNVVVHLIIWSELLELFLILAAAALTSRTHHQSELFGT